MRADEGLTFGDSYLPRVKATTEDPEQAIRIGVAGSPLEFDAFVNQQRWNARPWRYMPGDDGYEPWGRYDLGNPVTRTLSRTALTVLAFAGVESAVAACEDISRLENETGGAEFYRVANPVEAVAAHAAKGLAGLAVAGALIATAARKLK